MLAISKRTAQRFGAVFASKSRRAYALSIGTTAVAILEAFELIVVAIEASRTWWTTVGPVTEDIVER